MYPRKIACFRYIMVNTLHKGRIIMIMLMIVIIISRDSAVGRTTIVQAGRSVVRIPVRVRFFTSPKVQTSNGVHAASYSLVPPFSSRGLRR
jgi:hypothetical protein